MPVLRRSGIFTAACPRFNVRRPLRRVVIMASVSFPDAARLFTQSQFEIPYTNDTRQTSLDGCQRYLRGLLKEIGWELPHKSREPKPTPYSVFSDSPGSRPVFLGQVFHARTSESINTPSDFRVDPTGSGIRLCPYRRGEKSASRIC